MKHICHLCNKEYDCGKDCVGPVDHPCQDCTATMGVEELAIQCLSAAARMQISKTCKEVQFRLSAVWPDGFTGHDVRYVTVGNFSVNVLLSKEDKNGQNN